MEHDDEAEAKALLAGLVISEYSSVGYYSLVQRLIAKFRELRAATSTDHCGREGNR